MQSVELTQHRERRLERVNFNDFYSSCRTGFRQESYCCREGEVIRKEGRNGESKDHEVCAHTVPV
jgi:hypothetical protein